MSSHNLALEMLTSFVKIGIWLPRLQITLVSRTIYIMLVFNDQEIRLMSWLALIIRTCWKSLWANVKCILCDINNCETHSKLSLYCKLIVISHIWIPGSVKLSRINVSVLLRVTLTVECVAKIASKSSMR